MTRIEMMRRKINECLLENYMLNVTFEITSEVYTDREEFTVVFTKGKYRTSLLVSCVDSNTWVYHSYIGHCACSGSKYYRSIISVFRQMVNDIDDYKEMWEVIAPTTEPEETSEPEATETTKEPIDETDYDTHDEKRQTYLSVYRDLQQTLTHLRKCKTLRTYDRCFGQYIKKLNGMYMELKISYSMLYFLQSKISMQNAESGIWASEYEKATGYHPSRRYNKNRVDA